ncbi:sugar transporter [Orbaceae bacterium ESL0721]|nr:sugar transporter [Orbaceae bacterium ESL0721]
MQRSLSRSQIWSSILCLAFAAFVFNTTEFVPVGLLPNIAESFNMDVSHAGLLLTVYAWSVSLLSLPLTILTVRMDRRQLLAILFVLFIGSHILAGFAWSFYSLMAARIGIACAHAVFWAITTPLAVRLAPIGKKTKAMSFIVVGTSMATVLGIPIGTMIGQLAGWRVTFLGIAAIALCVMFLLLYLLPRIPSNSNIPLQSIPNVLSRPQLLHIFLLTAILITGHFTAYTYINPFMQRVGGFSEDTVVLLLLMVGFSGIIGSIIFATYAKRYPTAIFALPVITITLTLFILYYSVWNIYTTLIICMLWGLSITIISMVLQIRIIDAAPDATDVATSVYSGIYNIGIGSGAFIGGKVITYLSMGSIGFIGAMFTSTALIIFLIMAKKWWQTF